MSTAIAFDFDKARFNMIEQQIRPWNVLDADVLDLLAVAGGLTPKADTVVVLLRRMPSLS